MYTEVGFCDFCAAFRDYNRDDNFSYEGKRALYDYLEDYEDDTGEEIELDIIALCCDYTEWRDLKEFNDQHNRNYASLEELQQETTVIEIEDSDRFIARIF